MDTVDTKGLTPLHLAMNNNRLHREAETKLRPRHDFVWLLYSMDLVTNYRQSYAPHSIISRNHQFDDVGTNNRYA